MLASHHVCNFLVVILCLEHPILSRDVGIRFFWKYKPAFAKIRRYQPSKPLSSIYANIICILKSWQKGLWLQVWSFKHDHDTTCTRWHVHFLPFPLFLSLCPPLSHPPPLYSTSSSSLSCSSSVHLSCLFLPWLFSPHRSLSNCSTDCHLQEP